MTESNGQLVKEYNTLIEIVSEIQTQILNFDKEHMLCDFCKTKLLRASTRMIQGIYELTQQIID